MIHPQADTNGNIREAALRPLERAGKGFWLLVTPFALLTLWGVAAWGIQLAQGLQVTGLNDRVFWGMYETNLVTFIGLSYGGALVSAILRLIGAEWRSPIARMAEAMALVTLAIGGVFAFVHLGRPERLWRMLVTPQFSSPIVWDAIAITTYLVATWVFLHLPLIPDMAIARDVYAGRGGPRWRVRLYGFLSLGWRDAPEHRRLLAWGMNVISVLIIPLAITVHSVLSWAFALTTREGWHSTIFGPYFVVGALFSGVAAVILVVAAYRKAYRLHAFIHDTHFRYLGYLMMTLALMYLYFTFSEFLTEGYTQAAGAVHMLDMMLLHNYAPLFWLFVLAGIVVPVLLVALPITRSVTGIVTGAALVVGAMWLKRFLIVVPALSIPVVAGPAGIYSPSWVEMSISLGAAAAIPLLLMLFFRLFPVLAIWEMEHGAAPAAAEEPVRLHMVPGFQAERGDD